MKPGVAATLVAAGVTAVAALRLRRRKPPPLLLRGQEFAIVGFSETDAAELDQLVLKLIGVDSTRKSCDILFPDPSASVEDQSLDDAMAVYSQLNMPTMSMCAEVTGPRRTVRSREGSQFASTVVDNLRSVKVTVAVVLSDHCARVFAEECQGSPGDEPQSVIRWAFRQVLGKTAAFLKFEIVSERELFGGDEHLSFSAVLRNLIGRGPDYPELTAALVWGPNEDEGTLREICSSNGMRTSDGTTRASLVSNGAARLTIARVFLVAQKLCRHSKTPVRLELCSTTETLWVVELW